MEGNNYQTLKLRINREGLTGAAQKLFDDLISFDQNYLLKHIEAKWILNRRRALEHKLNKDDDQIEYEFDLLGVDEKQEIPNRILYGSFNCHYSGKQFIPGNFIHRQFSAYCKYFVNKYYEVGRVQVLLDKQVTTAEFTAVHQWICQIQRLIQFDNQTIKGNDAPSGKLLQQQGQHLESKLSSYMSSQIDQQNQVFKVRQQLTSCFKKYFVQVKEYTLMNRKLQPELQLKAKELQRIILDGTQRVRKIFSDIYSDHEYPKSCLGRRVSFQQSFRKQVSQLLKKSLTDSANEVTFYKQFYRDNKKNNERSKRVKHHLQKLKDQQFCKISVKSVCYSNERKKKPCYFAMGRLSLIDHSLRYIVLQPLSLGLGLNPICREKQPEILVMNAAAQKIGQLKQANTQFRTLVIDIFTEVSPDKDCKKFLQEKRDQIQQSLKNNGVVILRISYNNVTLWLPGHECIKGQIVQVGDIEAQQQYQITSNHHLFVLFQPKQIFPSSSVHLQTFKKTILHIEDQRKTKIEQIKKDLQENQRQDPDEFLLPLP